MTRSAANQQLHTPIRQGVPKINSTEEWGQKSNSEPVRYGATPMHGESLGQYHHKTRILPMNIRRYPSEHSVVIESQNSYNVPNDNTIDEVRHALLWRRIEFSSKTGF